MKFKIKLTNDLILTLVLIAILIAFGLANPDVLTVRNLFTQVRNMMVVAIIALGMFPIYLIGGFDVSFMANALFAQYLFLNATQYWGMEWMGVVGGFIFVFLFGMLVGLFNAFVITKYNFPAIIITIGVQGIIHGGMYEILRTDYFSVFKTGIAKIGRTYLYSYKDAATGVTVAMNIMVLFWIALALFMWWFLKYTMYGRSIFAVGGNRESASRAGISIMGISLMVYGFFNGIAAFGGLLNLGLMGVATPTGLYGTEFDVIGCIVLGGVSLGGGQGTVMGTILGVAIMTVVKNSLLMIGVPVESQRAFTGALMLGALGVQAYRRYRMEGVLTK